MKRAESRVGAQQDTINTKSSNRDKALGEQNKAASAESSEVAEDASISSNVSNVNPTSNTQALKGKTVNKMNAIFEFRFPGEIPTNGNEKGVAERNQSTVKLEILRKAKNSEPNKKDDIPKGIAFSKTSTPDTTISTHDNIEPNTGDSQTPPEVNVPQKPTMTPEMEARMIRRRKIKSRRVNARDNGDLGGKNIMPTDKASLVLQSTWRGRYEMILVYLCCIQANSE